MASSKDRKLERSESSKSVINDSIISQMSSNGKSNSNGNVTSCSGKGRRTSMFDPIDPLELQKTLYQNKNNNTIVESQRNKFQDEIGTIEYGVEYLADTQKLIVNILRVFDLEFSDEILMDTFCKCTLMPDKISFNTKVIKRNKNPIFEEKFEYENLELSKMDSRYLLISLFQMDKLKEDCLGATILKLNYTSIESNQIFIKDLKASLKSTEENYIGDLMFSMTYLPGAERLTIVVIKARNLRFIGSDKKHLPDTFVKVSVVSSDGKKLKKKKTLTQKASTSPVYNEELVFTNIKKEQLDSVLITFTLFHDSLTSKEMLGTISIGSSSTGNELVQWKDMLEGKKSIAWWHALNLFENENIDSDFNNNNSGGLPNRNIDKFQMLSERKMSRTNLLANLSNLKIKPVLD